MYPWVMGMQVCTNEEPRPFSRGNNFEIANIQWHRLKKQCANFINTCHKASLSEENPNFFSNDEPCSLQRGDNDEIAKKNTDEIERHFL